MFRLSRPTFVLKSLGTLPVLKQPDWDEISKVQDAYNSYFDHIRFRKGWAEPALNKGVAQKHFSEAAEYVVLIRKFLDSERPGDPVLRVRDGSAQSFLHSPEAAQVLKTPNKFVSALVQETFKEATGYVEGMSRPQIDKFLEEMIEHRFNPQVHATHLLRIASADMESLKVRNHEVPDKPITDRDNNYYVKSDSPEDELWRDVVEGFYKVYGKVEQLKKIEEDKKK